ncbi:MAG: hypothetical protein MJA83_03390, partial [Gammaproteobacteria bacterium]|nr:hypothetical protein [Gammaproteobacteria bacterium]
MANPLRGEIIDVETLQVIRFFSFEPPQKQRTAQYDDVEIRGRSEPHPFYSSTTAQIWSFSINFVASFDEKDRGQRIDVKEAENFMESFVMPDYGDVPGQPSSVVRSPHLCRIRILRMFDVKGTIRDLQFTFPPPYDADTGFPQVLPTSFTLHSQQV